MISAYKYFFTGESNFCAFFHCSFYHEESQVFADSFVVNVEDLCADCFVEEVDQRAHAKRGNYCSYTYVVDAAEIAAGNSANSAAGNKTYCYDSHVGNNANPFIRDFCKSAEHKSKRVVWSNADVGRKEQAA